MTTKETPTKKSALHFKKVGKKIRVGAGKINQLRTGPDTKEVRDRIITGPTRE